MSVSIRKSSLIIYKDCQILPTRNFIVESIETYLATLTNFSVADFQYLRPTLEMNIKIHKAEEFCAMLATYNYNYLKITQDDRIYYYFIIKKNQKAEETVELELRMDTINTFKYGVDFTATDRTKVLREHKDRFEAVNRVVEFNDTYPVSFGKIVIDLFDSLEGYKIGDASISDLVVGEYEEIVDYRYVIEYDSVSHKVQLKITFVNEPFPTEPQDVSFTLTIKEIKRKIDLYSEGLTPILYKQEKGYLYPPEMNNWYLIYKNKENPSPGEEVVECYLAPESPIDVKANSGNLISPSDLDSDVYYMFSRYANLTEDTYFKCSDGTLRTQWTFSGVNNYQAVILRKSEDGTKIKAFLITYIQAYIGGFWIFVSASQTFAGEYTSIQWISGPLTCYKGNDISTPLGNNYTLSIGSTTDISLNGISSFDKTLSTILKIIALPYLPCEYNINNNGVLILPTSWKYDATYGFMKLDNLEEKFESTIKTKIENPFTEVLSSFYNPRLVSDSRELLDSKIYHSDYYQPKFIYDSFGFVFQLEKMDSSLTYDKEFFEFKFVMTSTIRSRFMFKFEDYKLLYSTGDFDNILAVNRNNEVVIYNSTYITYLRTGYNIDVKAKERTQRTAILGGVLSTIGSIASIGLGVSKAESTAMGVGSVISGTSNIVSSIVNSVNTIAQSEESMERNLATLKAQAVSVEGADDLDLLENYSNNKAKLAVYKVSDKMKEIIDDLFYYTGYISGVIKTPSVNSRYWFNFLSCELDISGINSAIPEICLQDLLTRYQSGVFFLHNHSGNYNFALDKENWETSLL